MDNELSFTFTLPNDEDGFMEYECPFCNSIFRLEKNLFQGDHENDELFCPYCGLKSNVQNLYTTECVNYINEMKMHMVNDLVDKQLKDMAKHSKGLIKYKSKNKSTEPELFGLHIEVNEETTCPKCKEKFKTKTNLGSIKYCPYCGEIIWNQ